MKVIRLISNVNVFQNKIETMFVSRLAYNMASIFISKALALTSVEDVRLKFEELELGVIDFIDMKEYERDGSTFRKFWIHYSSYSKEEHAVQLMKRMVQNEKRQKEGELIPVGEIPRIVYGVNRQGNDMYWQVFVCKTPEQRRNEVKPKSKARIVM